jgi:hypothetical protein
MGRSGILGRLFIAKRPGSSLAATRTPDREMVKVRSPNDTEIRTSRKSSFVGLQPGKSYPNTTRLAGFMGGERRSDLLDRRQHPGAPTAAAESPEFRDLLGP